MYVGYIIVACSILCEVVKLIRELILKYLIIIEQYVESSHLISSITSSNVMIVYIISYNEDVWWPENWSSS